MKKQAITVFLCLLLTVPLMTGCGKQSKETTISDVSAHDSDTAPTYNAGTFQMDAVRSSIHIHGHSFTVPQKLSDLDEGLTYVFVDEEFDDGLYEVEISDGSSVILRSIAENAHRKSNKASLYNIALKDSDSDVLGIKPLVSTKEDVLRQFGEPTETKQSDLGDKQIEAYVYGTHTESSDFQTKGQFMNIAFNEDDIVISIVINYTD